MTLASVPVTDVYLCFDPTAGGTTNLVDANLFALPASGASNTYWTNITKYVLSGSGHEGKQHYVDRMESASVQLTLNNRDGFFTNTAVNGTTGILDTRCPLAITATVGATRYNVFFGITDSVPERVTDQLNSEIQLTASDQTKLLSQMEMNRPQFWKQYAQQASTQNWYRCTSPSVAIVTGASGNGTDITYNAINTFAAGDDVTITGMSNPAFNLANVSVASATSTSFTVASTVNATTYGTGSAYRAVLVDQMALANGNYMGVVSFPTYGAIIYDSNGCCDTANGGSTVSGQIRLPAYTTTMGGIETWILGQGIANTAFLTCTSGSTTLVVGVSPTGYLQVTGATITVGSTVKIDDGYWHHVGLISNSAGALQLYADGQFFALTAIGALTGWTSASNQYVGFLGALAGAAYYDEIITTDTSSLATLESEVQNRYVAGSLLQRPVNPAQGPVKSGDRIAEILLLAGYGTISSGAISLNSNIYFIDDSPTAWVKGASGNGYCDVEPFYWDSPPMLSTALDLILQITNTDIGSFYQKPDGTFAFHTQNYYGAWAWTTSTQSGTWTPKTFTIAADHVWTDDASSPYAYEFASLQVVRDDADVWTTVRITPQAGTDQVYQNYSAENRWGATTLTKSATLPVSLDAAMSTAHFLGYLFRSPLPRVAGVELRSTMDNGAALTAVVGAKLGDVMTFKRTPPNAAGSGIINSTMIIESRQYSFTPDSWHATFTLDPYPVRT